MPMKTQLFKLQCLKRKKEEYYNKAIVDRKDPLYGMGSSFRRKNTTEKRSKHRYGFKRYSVRQRHRVTKETLKYRRNRPQYRLDSILRPYDVNSNYIDNKKLILLIYEKYYDFDYIYRKFQDGYKDVVFKRIFSLIGLSKDIRVLDFLRENYLEILHEAIVKFMNSIDNYVEESGFTFYTYLVNIFPYCFSSSFSLIEGMETKVDIVKDIVGDTDVNIYGNLLSYHVYMNNMSNKEKMDYIKEIL